MPGRAGGHPGHGDAQNRRPLGQHPLYRRHRHVALDHVALDLGRMAAAEIGRDASRGPNRVEILQLVQPGLETGGREMLAPR